LKTGHVLGSLILLILAAATIGGSSSANNNYEYRHNYTDIGMAFDLPVAGADVNWMDMLGEPRVFLIFDFNSEHYSIEISVRDSGILRATDTVTDENLEKAWLGLGGQWSISQHSPLTIRRETVGDGIQWLVSGRLVSFGKMQTRSIRAVDNEADGHIDVVIEATDYGKVDYGLLENIVSSTTTYPVEVDWS